MFYVKPHKISILPFFDLEKQLSHVVQPNATSPGNKCHQCTSEALPFFFMTVRTSRSTSLPTLTAPILPVALRLRLSHVCKSQLSSSKQKHSKLSDPEVEAEHLT